MSTYILPDNFTTDYTTKKSAKRNLNTTLVYKFCVERSINCEQKTPFHFRLTREGFLPVDIFPTSGKVHVIHNGKQKYKKVNVIDFLLNHFK